MSGFENPSLSLYLAALIAGYALLFLTVLLPGPLTAFSTIIVLFCDRHRSFFGSSYDKSTQVDVIKIIKKEEQK